MKHTTLSLMIRFSVLILGGIPPGSVCVMYEIAPKNFTQILGP